AKCTPPPFHVESACPRGTGGPDAPQEKIHHYVSYSVPEEMKRGSVIGNIAKDLGLNVGQLSARKARIDPEDDNVQLCGINLNTGDLLVQERIDREGLCGKKASCVLKQELVLENPLELHLIHVTVLDANDNVPVFSQPVYKASLPENSPLDTLVVTVSASDADEGINSEISYAFDHASDDHSKIVSLNPKTGEVRVTGVVDYEKMSSYEMQISARDGLGLVSYSTLIVDLTDVNDNAPVINLKSLS
uniref:Cadherin domain-containing protein n=1 Tax=Hippocampus comes TaxID=109280 RepID=A0A3Q2XJF6_HIPCM